MAGLQQWAVTACVAALVCTLLYRLFPENSLGRQGRLLLPCLFLLAVLTPLFRVDFSFSISQTQTQQAADAQALEARLKQQTVSYVNDTLLKMANQALSSYGVQAEKVVTDINIASDGRIDMGQITVFIDEETLNMAALVRQVVEKRLGTNVVIVKLEENVR